MEGILGKSVQGQGGSSVASSALNDKKFIGIYFSAHWCPPCRQFTPVLAQWYKNVGKAANVEIVFASFDQDQAQYTEYFHSMPWLTLGFQSEIAESLGEKYGVQGIPALVILKPNGTVVSTNARGDITTNNGANAVANWSSK